MKEDFDYSQVPGDYHHCLYAQCSRAKDCLRFQTALHANASKGVFLVINPAYVASQQECPYFQADVLTRFAIGITHIFDNLPHVKAVRIRQFLYHSFGRSKFYRIQKKERMITPEEQAFICSAFKREGISEEPVWDEYVYKYKWE